MACDAQRGRVRDLMTRRDNLRTDIANKRDRCEAFALQTGESFEECLESDRFALAPLSQLQQRLSETESELEQAQEELRECLATAVEITLLTGRVTFIDVRDVGQGFGPLDDRLQDIEVAFRLHNTGTRHFAFSLRNDTQGLVHQAYLALVRDSFDKNRDITVSFEQRFKENGQPKLNSKVITIAVSK